MKHLTQTENLPQHFHSREPVQQDFIDDEINRCIRNLQMLKIRRMLQDVADFTRLTIDDAENALSMVQWLDLTIEEQS